MNDKPKIFRQTIDIHPSFKHDEGYIHDCDIKLSQMLFYSIARTYGKTIEKEYHLERRLEVMVATPDEFWKLVRDEAERYAGLNLTKNRPAKVIKNDNQG